MKRISQQEERPVIIIGAARSGTKILRSALAASPELVSFPYDINYIWKYGNYDIPHDELTKDDLTDEISKFIKKKFQSLRSKGNADRVLEKTVSNSLRIDFVKEIFPRAKIIHLFRDGRDVATSSRLCWQSSMVSGKIQQKQDVLKKIIDFPILSAWPYLATYFLTYTKRLISRSRHVQSWGPRFKGIDEAVAKYSLIEVCGIQWARCIDLSLKSLSKMKESEDYIHIQYEQLMKDPVKELLRITDFLEIKEVAPIKKFAESNFSTRYTKYWEELLSSDEKNRLMPHIEKSLKDLGYT